MNVLILGASGGIGKWAVEYALQDGHHVTAYVRHPEKVQITSDHPRSNNGQGKDNQSLIRTKRCHLVCWYSYETKIPCHAVTGRT